jgi:type I restriction enzyme S subunit
MTWAAKPLREILDQSGRHRAGDQDLPLLSITMRHGLVDQADKFKKRIASLDTSNYRIAYKNELVVGFPIDEGVLGFQIKYPAGIVSPAYDIWKLRSEEDCHIPYLERYLRSSQARNLYASRMQGAVARRRSLTKTDFLNLEIPFPPYEDQVRIAHLLSKVEGLIAQRKQHLQQLDDLLKSAFLEMFGDPILNPHGFAVRRLSEFYVNPKEGTKCGPFGSALKKDELVDSGVPVWNMDNIAADGQMVLPFRMWITAEKYKDLASYSVQDSDIIISRAGTVGKMCVAHMNGQPAIISTNLIRLRLSADLRPLHFVSLMLYCKGRVGRLKTGADGAFTHMNTGVLDSLEFPYPPVQLQDRFGEIAAKVRGIKSCYQQHLNDLEELYGALSQKAFKGELDLSRVRLPEVPKSPSNDMSTNPQPQTEEVAIVLPETDLLLLALNDREQLNLLLHHWLEAYTEQLGGKAFSVEEFLRAAESRAVESQPDRDFELGVDAYDLIKDWVYEALTAGRLDQVYPSKDIRVALRRLPVGAEG